METGYARLALQLTHPSSPRLTEVHHSRSSMPRARPQYIVGVDLGGTNIVVGAMPDDGSREIGLRSEPTHAERGAEAVVARIVSMIAQVISDVIQSCGAKPQDFIGVGVGAPGPL